MSELRVKGMEHVFKLDWTKSPAVATQEVPECAA
jgi:hypothetical protein